MTAIRGAHDNRLACAQTVVQPFALTDVKLLPSRFQQNMQRDSAWIASIPVKSLLHSFRNTAGVFSDKEHLFKPEAQSKHLTGYDGENCCTYNLLKLADRLFTYQPDSRIADYYERALYNHILGQQDPETSMVCYFIFP